MSTTGVAHWEVCDSSLLSSQDQHTNIGMISVPSASLQKTIAAHRQACHTPSICSQRSTISLPFFSVQGKLVASRHRLACKFNNFTSEFTSVSVEPIPSRQKFILAQHVVHKNREGAVGLSSFMGLLCLSSFVRQLSWSSCISCLVCIWRCYREPVQSRPDSALHQSRVCSAERAKKQLCLCVSMCCLVGIFRCYTEPVQFRLDSALHRGWVCGIE